MRLRAIVVFVAMAFFIVSAGMSVTGCVDAPPIENPDHTHLVILGGQSNMIGVNAEQVDQELSILFPSDNVTVVKHAMTASTIERWFHGWEAIGGVVQYAEGDFYDYLMDYVNPEIAVTNFDTITFVWAQGEANALVEPHLYKDALLGLLDNVRADVGRSDLNHIIVRLSDYGVNLRNQLYSDGWNSIRETQVEVADLSPLGAWIDTDNLNGENDELHFDKEEYIELATRIVDKTHRLISAQIN